MQSIAKFVLALLLSGAGLCAQDQGNLIITKATYGAGDVQKDVTSLLQQQVHGATLAFRVTNDGLGGDPIFGKPKTLFVRYQTGKGLSASEVTVREGDMLQIPAPSMRSYFGK